MTADPLNLTYHSSSFSQGKMDFAWEELTEEERAQAYDDWKAGKGLIGGDPRQRPRSEIVPPWGLDRPFFRALSLNDKRSISLPTLKTVLASNHTLEIEIGFGRGDFILDRAGQHPDRFFIGYEVKTKAVRLCLNRVDKLEYKNIWFSDDDVRFSLPRVIPDARISIIHILFPDPWWKEQHRVKRLFSPPFVDLLAAKIAPGGLLHFKSDVEEYGEMVRYLLSQNDAFTKHEASLSNRIGEFAPTHREHWCERNQKPVWAYYFTRH